MDAWIALPLRWIHPPIRTPTHPIGQRLSFPSTFADAYDLGLRLPTQWCASSTTHASLMALQRVLEVSKEEHGSLMLWLAVCSWSRFGQHSHTCASLTTTSTSQADPQCAQIFLVSGRDVPVFPPHALFHPRKVGSPCRQGGWHHHVLK